MKFRYDCGGRWFKGGVHIHTSVSDGAQTPEVTAEAYAGAGYDFIALTDHDAASHTPDQDGWPLVVLDGVEIDGGDGGAGYHALCLGSFPDLPAGDDYPAKLAHCRDRGGLIFLAHPHLMGHSRDDVQRHGYHGVEVYNTLAEIFGRNDNVPHWDYLLAKDPNALCLAVDDTHALGLEGEAYPEHAHWNWGWIVANAPECTPETILRAIRAGNYYSSSGPTIESIETSDDGRLLLRTSPIRRAWLIGALWQCRFEEAPLDELFTETEFPCPMDWPVLRIEIEDAQGRRAWTNPLFIRDA